LAGRPRRGRIGGSANHTCKSCSRRSFEKDHVLKRLPGIGVVPIAIAIAVAVTLGACGLLSLLATAYSDAYINRDVWVLDVDMHRDFEFACVRTTLDQAFGPSQVLEGKETLLIGMSPDAGTRSEWIYVAREPDGRLELDGTVDDAGARADEWTAKMSPVLDTISTNCAKSTVAWSARCRAFEKDHGRDCPSGLQR
jgi:hypothetical protein